MKTSASRRAAAACLLAALGSGPAWGYGTAPHDTVIRRAWGIQIYSTAFPENGYIPTKYTCDGENVSPPLHIRGVTPKARSLVLVVEDPDALGGDWVHWTVWNIDAGTRVISENSIPEGAVEGDTDFELPAWAGPCPREGVHRYVFRVYALDVMLDLPSRASKQHLDRAMRGHILDQGSLVGLYGRDPERAITDSWIMRKSTN